MYLNNNYTETHVTYAVCYIFPNIYTYMYISSGPLECEYIIKCSHICNVEKNVCNINDTFKRVSGILVNLHILNGILTMIVQYPLQNTRRNV